MKYRSERQDRTTTSTRRLRRIVLAFVAVVVCWLIFISVNIVFPAQGRSDSGVDAMVSLAPQFNRLPTAMRLVEETDQSVLLISYFPHDPYMDDAVPLGESPAFDAYCADAEDDRLSCFTPEDASTLGEASAIRDVAQRESWDSVTVVTSKYHVFRTRHIFQRCLGSDIDVNVVYSEPDLSATQWLWHIAYENAAYPKALFDTTFRC